jgi:hypothetical protein
VAFFATSLFVQVSFLFALLMMKDEVKADLHRLVNCRDGPFQ